MRNSPIPYSIELAQEVCDLVSSGSNLTDISRMPGMPHRMTMNRWRREHAEFDEMYRQARLDQADVRIDRIDQIGEDLRAGKIDFNMARELMSKEKWIASQQNPRDWGNNRVQQEVTGSEGKPFTVVVRSVLDVPRQLATQKVIEGSAE